MSDDRPVTILCLASEFKGVPFIQECHRQGAHVLLITATAHASADWPWESIHAYYHMPDLSRQPDMTYAVSYLARTHPIDRIVALDDYDVATAASLREHFRLPGMGESVARHFRDKLAMRTRARQMGVLVPAYTGVFNHQNLGRFLREVAPPWVLKPRFEAGAVGIQKMETAEQVWQTLNELGDRQTFYLLEQFVPGDVYHIDAVTAEGSVVFARASEYGAPPLAISHGGGIFQTRTLAQDSNESQALLAANQELLHGLSLARGVSHTEFIRAHADGRYYFLETAARVGGANIDRMVAAATGIELWVEAARIELAQIRGEPYVVPTIQQDHAGLIICLARQQWPDLSAFDAPEIVWRLRREYHAGLLFKAPTAARVESLLAEHAGRFAADFLSVQPPKKDVRTNI